ncbi:cobyric acid synthase [Clostridium sp. 1001271B_151109_B4]|uniref:cobyric acid synthase n=1 Tax=Clostridium sp. 1001271B_151109_B4 TaxID=2787148 RepID=UPI0018AC3A7C|nr:cobyric acid synthase [Clostridium sp. 1001271B_151109_B4]
MNKIMVLGTASGVGKSTVATALCRYYKNKGFKVAPFKALNISLNSYVTEDGLEMGRAQVVQAEACGLKPMAYMNPVLLKPSGNNKTQVIVNGKVHSMMDSYKYKELNKELKKIVKETFENFSRDYEVMILEGSGSCAEINLRETDIANMSMAKASDSDVILVADIDRGGVFASVVGTLMLLEESERKRVKGVIINKFRGNVDYFKDAMRQLEEIINIPVLGVLPYFKLDIEDEDSVTERIRNNKIEDLDIVVIRLPHMSNFTDFNSLEILDGVSVRYVENINDINDPDLVIIPGSKNTINDLKVIKKNGIFNKIIELKNKGTMILGICGGYQMLGENIIDSEGVEGEITAEKGFGFLSVDTIFNKEKTTKQTTGYIKNICNSLSECVGITVSGYEIHNGVSNVKEKSEVFIENKDGDILGLFKENVFGTYLHGIFDEGIFLRTFINSLTVNKGINILDKELIDYKKYKLNQYDELAKLFEENINLNRIFNR